jgi:hypothetical protein
MGKGDAPPPVGRDPLAGVLGRLMARERGATEPAAPRAPVATAVPRPADPGTRRLLVVAGVGDDDGTAALRSAAQWALLVGRRPSIVDLVERDRPAAASGADPQAATAGSDGVARAHIARDPESWRHEPAGLVIAALERLKRLESGSDLVLARVPGAERKTLVRAALLSGAIVLPVGESDAVPGQTLRLHREIATHLPGVKIWIYSDRPRALEHYLSLSSELGGVRSSRFDPAELDLAQALDGLEGPPDEGFISAVLAPAQPALPEEMLRLDLFPL